MVFYCYILIFYFGNKRKASQIDLNDQSKKPKLDDGNNGTQKMG